jgi:hypothetical protein
MCATTKPRLGSTPVRCRNACVLSRNHGRGLYITLASKDINLNVCNERRNPSNRNIPEEPRTSRGMNTVRLVRRLCFSGILPDGPLAYFKRYMHRPVVFECIPNSLIIRSVASADVHDLRLLCIVGVVHLRSTRRPLFEITRVRSRLLLPFV